MSEAPGPQTLRGEDSTLNTEQSATSAQPQSSAQASSTPKAPKSRSCLVCRTRKVRCDKLSPCSNCRRANIACLYPSTERTPRWARRLEPFASNAVSDPGVAKIMDRVRDLEKLVKELSDQLAEARATAGSVGGVSTDGSSPWSPQSHGTEHRGETLHTAAAGNIQNQFGRLVLQDSSHSRYVSSGFWSKVNDELDGLNMGTRDMQGDQSDSSVEETSLGTSPYTQESDRTPAERNAFLFRHNLMPSTYNHNDFHPLPSQIPFLLDVYAENVNVFMQIVHMPTVTKMMRGMHGNGLTLLTPANEALILAISYAAISSMEDEDVRTNFDATKLDLSLKYRIGFEHALAKADFLNGPDIILVQAFAIFLSLVRRHDSPRYVWMMTGLVVRMARYLGLQRDGTHFEHLNPFEIEMRRRVWWVVYILDLRASEDQGTDLTIASGSFDTRVPLNINDADISPNSQEMPEEREGVTDMSFARVQIGLCNVMIQMMESGLKDGVAGLEEQNRLLDEIYQTFERGYLQYFKDTEDITCWVGITITRLVRAKMTLILFLPVLFSSPSDHFSSEMRTKLLVAAIEVAECNHALNFEQACRKWRWVYQTYTHWYAIVYIMIEISRRPWSPIVERAWVALHSKWLIPAQNLKNKNMRVWFPLRKLMAKDLRHRNAELTRLRAAPQEAIKLDLEDPKVPDTPSYTSLSVGLNNETFRERWRTLVTLPAGPRDSVQPATNANSMPNLNAWSVPTHNPSDSSFNASPENMFSGINEQQHDQSKGISNMGFVNLPNVPNVPTMDSSEHGLDFSYPFPSGFSDDAMAENDFVPWLMADTDFSDDANMNLEGLATDIDMDFGGEMDWQGWIEAAKDLEQATGTSGNDAFSWPPNSFG